MRRTSLLYPYLHRSDSFTHSLTDALDQQRVVAISKPTGLERRHRQRWQVVRDPLPVVAATSVLVDLGVAPTYLSDEHQPQCRSQASVRGVQVFLARDGKRVRRESVGGLISAWGDPRVQFFP